MFAGCGGGLKHGMRCRSLFATFNGKRKRVLVTNNTVNISKDAQIRNNVSIRYGSSTIRTRMFIWMIVVLEPLFDRVRA